MIRRICFELLRTAVVAALLPASGAAGPFDSRPDDLVSKRLDQISSQPSADWGRAALAITAKGWQHGETAHFVIHHFRRGQSIATRSEKFYEAIRKFFGNRPDLLGDQKSHVYAFHSADDWRGFAATTKMGEIAGVTRGHEFFYLATDADGRFDTRAKVQAHEMTHLVFNRFFEGQPPLWLNEGIAEYFGQRETSSTADFRKLMGAKGRYPLDALFTAETYPADPRAVHGFYSEAAVIVDFLTHTADRTGLLPAFVEQMIAENDLAAALKPYGYQSVAEFKDRYERYRRTRY